MQWVRAIQMTRAKWKATPYSSVCSDHFTKDSFISTPVMSGELGIKWKMSLKPAAVPAIFPKPTTSSAKEPRKSSWQRKMIVSEIVDVGSSNEVECYDDTVDHEALKIQEDQENDKIDKEIQTEKCIVSSKKTQVNMRPTRVKGVQVNTITHDVQTQCDFPTMCEIQTKDVGIQCTISTDASDIAMLTDCNTVDDGSMINEEMSVENDIDSSFEMEYSESEDGFVKLTDDDLLKETKYIVFESCLMSLFGTKCAVCYGSILISKTCKGSLLRVTQRCDSCAHSYTWSSQPVINDIPAGNVLISSAILASGLLPRKVLRFFNFWNCKVIAPRTYFYHQEAYLFPAVETLWKEQQQSMFGVLNAFDEPLSLGGDGRCDSPGFSAKFGSYTLMDLEHNVILDFELVQSNEVRGSVNMEKEGLVRAMKLIEHNNLEVGLIVTDRHKQITKWIREEMPDTRHKFDVWHVAKSFRKKVEKVSKQKDCEVIGEWVRSMVNHLYWCIMSTEEGDDECIKEKWLSLLNHLHNKHKGHGKIYKECQHGKLHKRKWLKPNTKASDKVSTIIKNQTLCKQILQLSKKYQTSNLEAFHSLLNHFAPKSVAFSFKGMLAR
jgi:solute carrier family 8 (sodium/calcium exchanger)